MMRFDLTHDQCAVVVHRYDHVACQIALDSVPEGSGDDPPVMSEGIRGYQGFGDVAAHVDSAQPGVLRHHHRYVLRSGVVDAQDYHRAHGGRRAGGCAVVEVALVDQRRIGLMTIGLALVRRFPVSIHLRFAQRGLDNGPKLPLPFFRRAGCMLPTFVRENEIGMVLLPELYAPVNYSLTEVLSVAGGAGDTPMTAG